MRQFLNDRLDRDRRGRAVIFTKVVQPINAHLKWQTKF